MTARGFLVVMLRMTSVARATWAGVHIALRADLAASSLLFAPSFYGAETLSRWASFVASALGEIVVLVASGAVFAASGRVARRSFPATAPLSGDRVTRALALASGFAASVEAVRYAVLWAVYGGLPSTRPPTVHPLLFDPYATSLFHVAGFVCVAIVAFAGPRRVSGFVRRWFVAPRPDATGG